MFRNPCPVKGHALTRDLPHINRCHGFTDASKAHISASAVTTTPLAKIPDYVLSCCVV